MDFYGAYQLDNSWQCLEDILDYLKDRPQNLNIQYNLLSQQNHSPKHHLIPLEVPQP